MQKHTCALSPSYLNSHMNAISWNRFKTSLTPLVGWANMGFRGTLGVSLQCFGSSATPCSRIAGMIASYEGNSLEGREKIVLIWLFVVVIFIEKGQQYETLIPLSSIVLYMFSPVAIEQGQFSTMDFQLIGNNIGWYEGPEKPKTPYT